MADDRGRSSCSGGDASGRDARVRHAGEGFPGYIRGRRFSSEERGVRSEELARHAGCAGRRRVAAAFAAGAGLQPGYS